MQLLHKYARALLHAKPRGAGLEACHTLTADAHG